MSRLRPFNLGWFELPTKVETSWPSVEGFGWNLVHVWPDPRSKFNQFFAKSVHRTPRKGMSDTTFEGKKHQSKLEGPTWDTWPRQCNTRCPKKVLLLPSVGDDGPQCTKIRLGLGCVIPLASFGIGEVNASNLHTNLISLIEVERFLRNRSSQFLFLEHPATRIGWLNSRGIAVHNSYFWGIVPPLLINAIITSPQIALRVSQFLLHSCVPHTRTMRLNQ